MSNLKNEIWKYLVRVKEIADIEMSDVVDRKMCEVINEDFETAMQYEQSVWKTIANSSLEEMKARSCDRVKDIAIFRNINAAIKPEQILNQTGDLSISALNYAFSLMETNGFIVNKIVMNPTQYADLRLFGRDVVNEEIFCEGACASLWGANIFVSNNVAKGDVFLLPSAGVFSDLFTTEATIPVAKIKILEYKPVKDDVLPSE